jgi:tripartite-type tricarboxylate transporter receptor subunit TctC
MKWNTIRIGLSIALSISFFGPTAPSHAEVSFKGQTVNLIINSNPGGGTDLQARLLGGTIAKYLPGGPRIVFNNMPGGGGIKANNYFVDQVKRDGRTMISGARSVLSPLVLRSPGVKFNTGEYEFVGGSERLSTIVLIRNSVKDRLTDAEAEPVVFGDIDGERTGYLITIWGREFLGWNVKSVIGYSGTSQMLLAARSGELDMIGNQNAFIVGPFIKEAGYSPVVQMGVRGDGGRMIAAPAMPDVPVFNDLILPKLHGDALAAYSIWLNDQLVDKWVALPPGTPAEIVAAYREAYAKAGQDSELLARTEKEFGESFSPISGEELTRIAKALADTKDEDLQFFNNLRAKYKLPGQ